MARTPEERLEIADTELDRAFRLINELWANKYLDVFFTPRTLTEPERQIRELIVDTRIAIINASNQIELIRDNN